MSHNFERSVTPGGLRVAPQSLSWSFSRSSGPGGQHVNTTDSKVELRCDVTKAEFADSVRDRMVAKLGSTEIRVTASTHRSQRRNREMAWELLAERLDSLTQPTRRRRPTKPSRGSVERRLKAKRQQSERKSGRRQQFDD